MTRSPLRLALATVLLAVSAGNLPLCRASEDAPPVVRVRLRWDEVERYFPAGTPTQTLPLRRVEALLAGATEATGPAAGGLVPSAGIAPQPPVRIDHEARWDGQALVGRSRVQLPPAGEPVLCQPWSPALRTERPPDSGASEVWADSRGRLLLARGADPLRSQGDLAWQAPALPGSAGRVFALRLPGADVARLVLDLPIGVVPRVERDESPASPPLPEPTPLPLDPALPGRHRWELLGAAGLVPLSLVSSPSAAPPTCSVSGTTRVDLSPQAGPNWVAHWRVAATAPSLGPTRLSIALPAGLDVVDVTGPDLLATERVAGRRLTVTFHAGAAEQSAGTTLQIRGLVAVPAAGRWEIPTARPSDAPWLGGRVTVISSADRPAVLLAAGNGRRVAPTEAEAAAPGTTAFVFEDDGGDGPVATCQFDSVAPGAVTIRGTLQVGEGPPRCVAEATWLNTQAAQGLVGGLPADPTLDLAPGWTIERATRGDGTVALAWSLEPTIGGGTRLHLDRAGLWAGNAGPLPASRSATVRLVAVWRGEGFPLAPDLVPLPRVRPGPGSTASGAERWEAVVDPGWVAEPQGLPGVVWVDPEPTEVSPSSTPTAAPADDAGTRLPVEPGVGGRNLAWVWVAEPASAPSPADPGPAIRRHRATPGAHLADRTEAAIIGDRLHLSWQWTVAAWGRPDLLACRVNLPPDQIPCWRVETATGSSRIVAPVLLPNDRAAALSLDPAGTGTTFGLPLASLPPGPLLIRGEAEIPWGSSGAIPLVDWPATLLGERSVVVRVEGTTWTRADRVGGLDPVASPPALGGGAANAAHNEADPPLRVAGAWSASHLGPAVLGLTTGRGHAVPGAGAWITEAVLTSRVAPGIAARHGLLLRVAADSARTVAFKLPKGAILERVRRDGQLVPVVQLGADLGVTLAPPGSSRAVTAITLDYRTPAEPSALHRLTPGEFLPRVDLPCLSFAWQLKVPEPLACRSLDPSLVSAAPPAVVARRGSTPAPPPGGANPRAVLADLGDVLSRTPPLESALGDWLIRLDGGPWPILVDRLALQAEGWGPRSRINLPDFDPTQPPNPRGVFAALGLALESVGSTLLVTTQSEFRHQTRPSAVPSIDLAGFADLLQAAAGAGADPSDRYQTPTCWRGEITPRDWLASETPGRDVLAPGWRSCRFVAVGWPTAGAAVALDRPTLTGRELTLVTLTALIALSLLGLAWPRMGRGARPPQRPDRAARTLPGLLAVLVLVPALLGWGHGDEPAARVEPAPVLILLPTDDPTQPAGPDTVALIRQEDLDRLVRRPAVRPKPARPDPVALQVTAATHRVEPKPSGLAVVRSRFAVRVAGGSPESPDTALGIPTGTGFDWTLTVDGRPWPLRISADAETAWASGLPTGRSVVEFGRLVQCRLDPDGLGRRIDEAVVPMPQATIEVPRDPEALAVVDLPGVVGPRDERPDASAGCLGPTDRLVVTWRTFEPVEANQDQGKDRPEVALLTRWDAGPTGDHLTLRGTVVGSAPLRVLRLALEPGLTVRRQAIPHLIGVVPDPTAAQPTWAAFVDPPLSPGQRFEVMLQRPAPTGGLSQRPAPRWGLPGVVRHGLIGLRVPDGWTGRLNPNPGLVVPPAALVREIARYWGIALPEGLGPAGLARLDALASLSAHLTPPIDQPVASDALTGAIGPDGLWFGVDSRLSGREAAGWEARAVFPEPVQITRVEAPGLAAWDQPQPDAVRLVFATAEPPGGRVVHLEGRCGRPISSPAEPTGPISLAVPQPRWSALVLRPARLTVVGPDSLGVVDPSGRRLGGEAQPNLGETVAPAWEARRWSGENLALDQARIRWEPVPPRVELVIRSDLRASDGHLVWQADVDIVPVSGPVPTLQWQIPTAWAVAAQVEVDGRPAQPRSVEQGEVTQGTIPLDPPVWRRRALRLRATRSWTGREAIDYPVIAMMGGSGPGLVSRYEVGFANSSSTPLTPLPTGLAADARASGVSTALSNLPAAGDRLAYLVGAGRWSLRLVASGLTAESGPGRPRRSDLVASRLDDRTQTARVTQAHLDLTLGATQVLGRAELQVEPGSAFVSLRAPSGAGCLGATVEERAVTPLVGEGVTGPGQWVIPLGGRAARRVVVAWTAPRPNTDAAIVLPSFPEGAVPTTVRLCTRESGADWLLRGGHWARQAPRVAASTRLDRLATALIDPRTGELLILGRGDGLAESGVVVDRLVALLLAARTADRMPSAPLATGEHPSLPSTAVLERVRAATRGAGREDLFREAEERVGQVALGPGSSLTDSRSDGPDLLRLRPLGSTAFFQGVTSPDPAAPPTVLPGASR